MRSIVIAALSTTLGLAVPSAHAQNLDAASRFWACADGTARPRVVDNAAITIERMIPSYRPTTLLPQKGQPVRRRVKIPPVPGVFYRQRPGWTFPRAVRGEGAVVWDETGPGLLDAA